ncbi:MAG: AI-2E family transporter, partial [Sphingomonadales bacterium]
MKKSWQIWLGVLALMIFIYATRAILLPFIVGLAVAYLLDPLADRLEARKVPRWLAAASLLVLFFILASGALVAIFPLLKTQMTAFIQNLPDYIGAARPLFDDL